MTGFLLFDVSLNKFPGFLKETTVIEVEAGPGGLTRALLEADALKVIVIETDQRCIPALIEVRHCVGSRLVIHHADALELDLSTLERHLSPRIIVANLPYHISVPLTIQWLKKAQDFKGFFLMFQKEVADRLTASPGTKTYGRLSVMAQ